MKAAAGRRPESTGKLGCVLVPEAPSGLVEHVVDSKATTEDVAGNGPPCSFSQVHQMTEDVTHSPAVTP